MIRQRVSTFVPVRRGAPQWVNLLTGTLLVLSTSPLTTILKTNGINVNALPAQIAVTFAVIWFYFDTSRRQDILSAVQAYTIFGAIVFVHTFVHQIPLTDILLNTLVVYHVVLIFLTVRWPGRERATHNIEAMMFWYFFIFSLVSDYYLLLHIGEKGWTVRWKGLSSGTTHGIVCLTGLCFVLEGLILRRISKLAGWFIGLQLIIAVIALQSRGILATAVPLIGYQLVKYYRFKVVFVAIPIVFVIYILGTTLTEEQLPFLKRFNVEEYEDLESFTSGRLGTQEIIVGWFVYDAGIGEKFTGRGFNQVKKLVNGGELEYPHFDLLYVLFEGGLLLLGFYVVYTYLLITRSRDPIYPLAFLSGSLHANMVAAPQLMIMMTLLSYCSKMRAVRLSIENSEKSAAKFRNAA